MEILFWMLLGGLIVGSQTQINRKLTAMGRANWKTLCSSLLATLTIAFSLAWAVSSYLENEVQAANMGLLVFGGIGVAFGILTYRMATSVKQVT